MNQPLISVIMSTYNDELYIEESLQSILNQTLADFELIIYDDCSSDHTVEKIRAFQDSRIQLICNEENCGLTKNLNKGLRIAKGKYIQFIDSDDWIEQDCFEKLFLIAEDKNADIVISDFYVNSKNNVKIVRQRYTGNLIEDLFTGRVFGGLCHKLVKKAAIDNASIAFNHQLNFCEDLCFLCAVSYTHLTLPTT